MKILVSYFLAVLMLSGAAAHLIIPEFYLPMIPDFISPQLANVLAALVELGVGVLLLIPKYRSKAGLGFFFLMIAFLPLHIWDLFKEVPAVGSFMAAVIRLLLQLVLIYAGWWVYRSFQTTMNIKGNTP